MNDCPKCGLLGGASFTHACLSQQPKIDPINDKDQEIEKLRQALLLIFLDPLTSHGGRAVAREALGIPFIPFASPEKMLEEVLNNTMKT